MLSRTTPYDTIEYIQNNHPTQRGKILISFNMDNWLKIELSEKEKHTVLQFCQLIEPHIQEKINSSSGNALFLHEEDAKQLLAALCYSIEKVRDRKVKSLFDKAIKSILKSSRDNEPPIEENDEEIFSSINDACTELSNNINKSPDPELGNLSPTQVHKLIYSKWDNDDCPIKFNKNLSLDELNHSIFFRNTRIFLKTIISSSGAPATVRGNLGRKFVAQMFEEIELDDDYRKSTTKYNKVLNETDVFPLHLIKIICKQGELIQLRSKKFHVKKKYHKLLSDDNAGELYYLLFRTFYEVFCLGYLDRFPEFDSLQGTINYTLCRFSVICNDYIPVDINLFHKIVLPAVREQIRQERIIIREIGWLLQSRILKPLINFGLIEGRIEKGEYVENILEARKTPLYDKFMSFEL